MLSLGRGRGKTTDRGRSRVDLAEGCASGQTIARATIAKGMYDAE